MAIMVVGGVNIDSTLKAANLRSSQVEIAVRKLILASLPQYAYSYRNVVAVIRKHSKVCNLK